MNQAHKITCDLDEDCSCEDAAPAPMTDVAPTDGVEPLGALEARLKLVTDEEFASFVHRVTMRAGVSPKGILAVVHWGARADVNVLLPTVEDPGEAAEILQELRGSAELSVDDLFRTKGDA